MHSSTQRRFFGMAERGKDRMTAREALFEIEAALSELNWYLTKSCKESFDMAIEALRKQIPMKVRVTTSTKRCSVCNRQLSGKGNLHPKRNYCVKCGQKICWDNDDEVRLNGGN